MLRPLAEENHVLTWLSPLTFLAAIADTLNVNKLNKLLVRLLQEPVFVGVGEGEKVTFPLQPHDESVFAPIEKKDIASNTKQIPKQVLLLAYRALCSIKFRVLQTSVIDTILEVAKNLGYHHSLSEPEKYSRWQRILANEIVPAVY
jgi:hypothetical protein